MRPVYWTAVEKPAYQAAVSGHELLFPAAKATSETIYLLTLLLCFNYFMVLGIRSRLHARLYLYLPVI